jgi:phage major head subunit gpT-like protein
VDINVFTAAMRTEFLNAYEQVDPATPAPYEAFTAIIPSTARIENYAWLSPVPGIQQYKGHRRLGNIDAIKYTVTNLEFDASFEVLNRDVEDDQVGGYMMKPKDLARKAKLYPGRLALKTLAAGETTLCFDGTNFFATAHNIGSAPANGNLLTFDGAANDGATHKAILLIHDGPIKPLVYQDRKKAEFNTDAGTPGSKFSKKSRYWTDLEGAGAFGFWWDAIKVNITDTPTIPEAQTILANMANQLRGFKLPKATPSDDDERPHEQLVFGRDNATLVVSSQLGEIFRTVLNAENIVASAGGGIATNIYRGFANLVVTGFLG